MIKNEKGEKGQRAIALCTKCNKTLKNTAISRLSAHRNNCLGMKKASPLTNDTHEDDDTILEDYPTCEDEDGTVKTETLENKVNGVEPQQKKMYAPVIHEVVQILEPKVNRVAKSPKAKEIVSNKISPRPRPSQVLDTISISKVDINDALCGFLIGANLNFEIADSKYFLNFVKKLAPHYEVPSGHELKMSLLKKLSCNQLMDHIGELSDDDDIPRGSVKRRMKRSRTNGNKRRYIEVSTSEEEGSEHFDRHRKSYKNNNLLEN